MKSLVLVVTLVLCGLHASAASPDVPNLVVMMVKPNITTMHPTKTAHVTNTTTTNHTTAHVTNTTTPHPTKTAHVTNATTTNHTTAHVTNTTTTNHTTTMHALTTLLPTLSPNFSMPETGQYNVSIKNTMCIKAAIGLQFIVKQKANDLYFNIPPAKTVASGKCGNTTSWIRLKFNSGFVNFTFVQDGKQYYISEISVALQSMTNLDKSYHGRVTNMQLFKTTLGHSYTCKRQQVVAFSTDSLQLLTVNTQLQAFGIPGGKFGQEEECFSNYRYIVPIIFGVGLFLLIICTIIVYLVCRHRRIAGYQRI
ncbi:lysosome-associated membrane glycoprotein 3-like isoform X2 [Heterodontus francisci]|uniref:lysosome-associated membrane glycoprotein 3-like isoform X2 n=1 Tax=Heterodontus francisci TaxID=7792 RepID=UPI00355C3B27